MKTTARLIFELIESKISTEPEVLSKYESLLKNLIDSTGQNFGDNVEDWVNWYIDTNNTEEGKAFLKSSLKIYHANIKFNKE